MTEFEDLYRINKREVLQQDSSSVNTSRPRILHLMSDDHGEWVTPKQLKYFQMPHPLDFPLSLFSGYENYQMRDEEYFKPKLNKLEKYIMKNGATTFLNETYLLYHSERNNWSIKATKFGNIIYMVRSTEQERSKTEGSTYHFKFHQYCFSDSPNTKPKTDVPFDENNLLFGLIKLNVDDFEILYSSEIVGVESKEEITDFKNEGVLNKCNFVLTKLLWEKSLERYPDWRKNMQLLGTWIQSYLGCVKNIYVGFKSSDGFIKKKIEQVTTESFPNHQYWKPEICKRFLRDFLRKVQATMESVDCAYTVFEFKFDSEVNTIKYRVFQGKTEYSFLDETFIQFMKKN